MELIVEVVSAERFMLGDNASHRFLPAGGVIGRSSECDWVIPDQTRHLSGRHAIISYEAGQFYVTDISTNGVYLNGPEALPKNVAVPLQDEDRLVMGEYQFRVRVQMDVRAQAVPPVRPVQAVAPVLGQGVGGAAANPMAAVDAFIADRQQQALASGQPQEWHRQSVSMPDHLRPEQEAFVPPKVGASQPVTQLPDDWMDLSVVPMAPAGEADDDPFRTLFEAPPPVGTPVIPQPGKRLPPAVQPTSTMSSVSTSSVSQPLSSAAPMASPHPPVSESPRPVALAHAQSAQSAPQVPLRQDAALAAFAEGLGLSADDIAKAGGELFMKRAGALLRQCLQGLVTNAQARASLKNEFRLDMTLVNPRANNPIKFSAHGDQVLRHLLSRDNGSFLPVEEAVQECIEDFQHHQLAMMAGMQQAFLELIQQLSPDELERRFDRIRNKGLSLSGKGARYWESYRELHQELQEEDDIFASMFAEPFARAYDEQIKKLKHSNRKKGKTE